MAEEQRLQRRRLNTIASSARARRRERGPAREPAADDQDVGLQRDGLTERLPPAGQALSHRAAYGAAEALNEVSKAPDKSGAVVITPAFR